jgi:hypothetical protein
MSQPVTGPPRSTPSYPTPPAAVPVRAPAPTPVSGEFAGVLNSYRQALIDSKVQGDVATQTRVATLKTWLDGQLQTTQARVNTSRATIQSFVDDYAGSSSEIEGVRKKFQEVRARGPVLQDVYETDKKSAVIEQTSYNLTPIYSKSALVVGLAVVAGLVWSRM